MENLAALCEHRRIPFVGARYAGELPKGIEQATCADYVQQRVRRRL